MSKLTTIALTPEQHSKVLAWGEDRGRGWKPELVATLLAQPLPTPPIDRSLPVEIKRWQIPLTDANTRDLEKIARKLIAEGEPPLALSKDIVLRALIDNLSE